MSFRIEPALPGHPKCYRGVCGNCGRSAPGERAVDTYIEVDHQDGIYGRLYLCESCVREWAQALGMLTAAQADELRQANHRLSGQNHELRERLEHYAHLEALLVDGERERLRRVAEREGAEQRAKAEDEPAIEAAENEGLPPGMVPVVPRGRRK